MKKALAKEPKDRYPSVEQMLTVLVAIADAWEALGRAPDEKYDEPTVTPSSAGRKAPGEGAWEPFVPGAGAPLAGPVSPERSSIERMSPDGAISIEVSPLDTVLPSATEPPGLTPSLPSTEVLALPVRSRADARGAATARLLGRVLVLGAALGAASALAWWHRAPRAVPRLAHAIRPVALRHLAPCPLAPAAAANETPAAVLPAAPQALTNGQAAITPRAVRRPWSPDIEACDGTYAGYVCGCDRY
jgi:hypothetical protein